MKLIDADKLKEYLTDMKNKYPGPVGGALYVVLQQIEYGTFSPTPPVQPDIKPGDNVRHKDQPDEIGEAWEHPKVFARFKGKRPAYYRLDKLEVITDDQPTEKA